MKSPAHDPKVAPVDALRREMRMLQDREVLRTTLEVEEAIFIQSLAGRAHEGHGTFAGRRYVDTTEDDIARALGRSPGSVAGLRQRLIDDVADFARRVMAGERPRLPLNARNEPLFGFSPFRCMEADPVQVLAGLYLGGMRDTQEMRLKAERRYGVNIGTGRLYFVDLDVMRRMGLDGDRLAHGSHADQLEEYRRQGLIVDKPPTPDNNISYMYIRHHAGPGASDDAAIVLAGLLHGAGAAVGVFLADGIDTLEKYVPPEKYGDQDAELAREIAAGFPDLPVGEDDARRLTYLSRGGEGMADSSLRHMLRVDREVDQCAIEAHLLHAAGRPAADMGLAHEKVSTDEFYHLVDARLREAPG